MRAISVAVDFMFRLKVLIIKKSNDINIINISNCTLYIVHFSLDLIFYFWPIFVDFRTRPPVYALITQLIKT